MMKSIKSCVLTINGGSSSIKFALYEIKESLLQLFYGEMERIGTPDTKLSFTDTLSHKKNSINLRTSDQDEARETRVTPRISAMISRKLKIRIGP